MITTNLPQFIQQINLLNDVRVHDTEYSIELEVNKPVDVQKVDDLVCDALFVDPVSRKESIYAWIIKLDKRTDLRGASDMQVVDNGTRKGYRLRPL
jgi:hypothetical protein